MKWVEYASWWESTLSLNVLDVDLCFVVQWYPRHHEAYVSMRGSSQTLGDFKSVKLAKAACVRKARSIVRRMSRDLKA